MGAFPRAADVGEAASRIAHGITNTPMVLSQTLSKVTGAEVWLKLENLQFTASFKERGALNRLLLLDAAEKRRGVIAMSAGNHAQALAFHARNLGIAATIVMPKATPFVKVSRTKHHEARVILHGDSLAEAAAFAHDLAAKEELVFVHPYDDPAVLCGQGTVALEMLELVPDLDCLMTPLGGGGLAAGCVLALAEKAPHCEVIGVEVETYAAAAQILAGKPVEVGGATIAEGIAVRDVGKLPMAILQAHGTEVMVLPEALIEKAIILLIEIEKTVTEGAGAAGLAALLAAPERFRGRKVGLVLSGGNIDTRTLANVLMRGLVRDGRLINLTIDIADRPGALAKLAQVVADSGGNIVEVQHQRLFGALSVNLTEIELLVEVQDAAHGQRVVTMLGEAGFPARLK